LAMWLAMCRGLAGVCGFAVMGGASGVVWCVDLRGGVMVCIVYRVVLMRGDVVRPGNAWFYSVFCGVLVVWFTLCGFALRGWGR
ncbi:hypothetical protein AAGW05_18590, partial [Arthrobacter sp. LAPM80]|uniref:hypothetical protein n=1 Tax=Arthrobacter sp. LAPM80 TaxID=3141788 RepID=UPI00398AAA56